MELVSYRELYKANSRCKREHKTPYIICIQLDKYTYKSWKIKDQMLSIPEHCPLDKIIAFICCSSIVIEVSAQTFLMNK